MLWNLSHSSADKPVAGKLSLCIGLPVMIKSNVATELCITNGQEATVVGWQTSTGKQKQQILDVLFVKLKSPPKTIQVDGLPENVVPLTRSTVGITCKLPNDVTASISRSQVEILPNFSMTDFASQGKTRPYNPVDLNNCRSYQAYYTALSHSSSAEGTIVLQGFDAGKITGKASGALRQEFHDLELLDEITKLQYRSKLPSSVHGDRRNSLIHTFRTHKGLTYVPKHVHCSIQWNKNDPMLEPIADNLSWSIIKKPTVGVQVDPQSSRKNLTSNVITPQKSSKRKEITPEKEHRQKIIKTQSTSNNMYNNSNSNICIQSLVPQGTIWHQNSCAYDAVLCIIHTIWNSNRNGYTQIFQAMNDDVIGKLVRNFEKHTSGSKSLESTRDDLRRYLQHVSPRNFTWGRFSSVTSILQYLLSTPSTTIQTTMRCKNNHVIENRASNTNFCLLSLPSPAPADIATWMSTLSEETNITCSSCTEKLVMNHKFMYPSLPLIALDFSGHNIQINYDFDVSIDDRNIQYKLCGIIYFGDSHFTSRILYDNMVWFHDSVVTGQTTIYEGIVHDLLDSLNTCRGKDASLVVYVKC